MSWNWNTTRRSELPANWKQLRQQVFARDNHTCVITNCTAKATDCDHIGYKLDHSMHNLRSLCAQHHREHTLQQSRDTKKDLHRRLHRFKER